MKKVIVYSIIILPIICVAIKWKVWEGGIGGVVLAAVAMLICTLYNGYESEKKKSNR